jgi:drug/metabolite transporter (DMT)-like permease
LTLRKYFVILSIVFFGSVGDAFLARGMKHVGSIDIHHVSNIFLALANPFVVIGILLLLGFMYSYMTALSFADLTYVMPATALGYVVMVLLSIFWLHEHVSAQRWIGVAFIVIGVGVVAGGPSRTEHHAPPISEALPEEAVAAESEVVGSEVIEKEKERV